MRLWGHWFERGGFHCASVGVKPLSRGLECFRKGRCDVWWMWSEVRKSVKRRDCFVNSTLEFFGSFVVEKQLYWLCGGGMLIEGVNDLPVKFSPRVGTSPITLVPDSTYQVFCQWRKRMLDSWKDSVRELVHRLGWCCCFPNHTMKDSDESRFSDRFGIICTLL